MANRKKAHVFHGAASTYVAAWDPYFAHNPGFHGAFPPFFDLPNAAPIGQPMSLEEAQAAAKKVHDKMVDAGEAVTWWKVVRRMLAELGPAWKSLGLQLHEVPHLRELFLTESKVNAFINCYVAEREILSVYDLEWEICMNEGIPEFEQLHLGPFCRNPLVRHYFSKICDDLSDVPRLRAKDIIGFLHKFMEECKEQFTAEEFLDYLAKQKGVSGKEKLGVRIQTLELHLFFLLQARRDEIIGLKQSIKTSAVSNRGRNSSQNSSLRLGKGVLDQRFDMISRHVKSVFSGFISHDDEIDASGEHTCFGPTNDEIDAGIGLGNDLRDDSSIENPSFLFEKDGCKNVSGCPHPSTTEDTKMPGLKFVRKSKISKRPDSRCCGKKRKFKENCFSLCKHAKIGYSKRQKFRRINVWKDGHCDGSIRQMVNTLAESDSTEEQIKVFNINCQNVPELPEEDSGPGMKVRDLASYDTNQFCSLEETTCYDVCCSSEFSKLVDCGREEDSLVPIELEGDWIYENGLATESTFLLEDSMPSDAEPQMAIPVDLANEPSKVELKPRSSSSYPLVVAGRVASGKRPNFPEDRDSLCRAKIEKLRATGRLGEAVVYNYFLGQQGSSSVKWVNKDTETGLPYDIVITGKENVIEYMEVKATISSRKHWFHISLREWQFAQEKGDSFSIAHVVLSGQKKASITVLNNPYKLCQQKKLQLTVMMSSGAGYAHNYLHMLQGIVT